MLWPAPRTGAETAPELISLGAWAIGPRCYGTDLNQLRQCNGRTAARLREFR